MQIVSTNPSEFGFIAVGQEAWGFIAIGQMARGVLVFGQLAVGVAGVGQCCACIWGIGQVGFGVAWFTGMVGIGGRGFGGVLRLIPGLDPPRRAPDTIPLEQVLAGARGGFVQLDVIATSTGPALGSAGQGAPFKLTPQVAGALAANSHQLGRVIGHVRREGSVVVCDRLIEVPGARSTKGNLGLLIARLATLAVVATAWWFLFVELVLFP